MKWVKRVAALLIVIAVLIWSIFFGIENQSQVSLSLVFIRLPQASLSTWMVASFILGALLSLLLISSLLVKQKSRYLLIKRQLDKSKQQISESHPRVTGK